MGREAVTKLTNEVLLSNINIIVVEGEQWKNFLQAVYQKELVEKVLKNGAPRSPFVLMNYRLRYQKKLNESLAKQMSE